MYSQSIFVLAKPPRFIRRKSSCPYKEELFKCPDWLGYRNDLQRWQKEYKLFPIPKLILPFKEYRKSFIDNEALSEFNKKQRKNSYAKHFEEINMKELPRILDQQGNTWIDRKYWKNK